MRLPNEDSISRIRAFGAMERYKAVYFATCLRAAPSQVQSMISCLVGCGGVYRKVWGPMRLKSGKEDAIVDESC